MKSSVIHEERSNGMEPRLYLFPVIFVLALLGFAARLWYLQVYQSEELSLTAKRISTARITVPAPRGLIVDRRGRVLAGVQSQYVVTGVPSVLRKNPHVLPRLASILGTTTEALQASLQEGLWRPSIPTPIYEGATDAQAARVLEDTSLEGVDIAMVPLRQYRDPQLLTHVLGYVRAPNERDVERYKSLEKVAPDQVGKAGLEFTHDFALVGRPGDEAVRMARGARINQVLETTPPVPGDRLTLGIDLELQRYAFELLGERNGAIVAIEPATGLVLAFVSKPSYDPVQALKSRANYQALLNDSNRPQWNRAIQTGYPPGSTFKIVTAIAGVLTGNLKPGTQAYCRGFYQVGRRRPRCLGVHGSVSFERAFSLSCNAFFMDVGMRAGPDALRQASEMVGFGSRTGIDLLGEVAGIVPSEERLQKTQGRRWFPGDTANFSIGQGELSVTPIQLANLAAFVANRGRVYRPHFVREQLHSDGRRTSKPPELAQEGDLPEWFWTALHQAMVRTVSTGTARAGILPGLTWGGKTGSSQNHQGRQSHSLFLGVAPLPSPQIVIAVIAENAGSGGEVAAPIASRLIDRYLRPPNPGQVPATTTASR